MNDEPEVGGRKFTADNEAYAAMLSYVLDEAEKAGMVEKQRRRLRLGFEEAVANIINYAYEDSQEPGEVWIAAYARNGSFFLELKDQGKPFNPLRVEDALKERPQTLQETKIGGLGIAFMRRVFDDMTYHYGAKDGLYQNHMILGMKITSPA